MNQAQSAFALLGVGIAIGLVLWQLAHEVYERLMP